MSIAQQDGRGHDQRGPSDFDDQYADWGDGPAAYEPGERPSRPGDRTPPQDNAAEQSVLGAMLLSKDAIADVADIVRGIDFYRPAHEVVHDAIIDLYGRGEPADPVTVAAELQRRGELVRVGGAPYLHTLSANVPIAANAGYYAEIVREKAILRRLVDAGTKIVQLGYAGEGQVDDVVDTAQEAIYMITDRRTAEDYAPLSDIMDGVLDEIEAIGNREAGLYGVPTGFADLDDLTNGLHAGQMIIVAGRPAMGKALALDTPLPTPTGWTTMGEVAVGDLLYDASGRTTRVVGATEVMTGRPCYEVRFSDGSMIVADAQHQWLTETRAARASKWAAASTRASTRHQQTFPSVVTTEEMARTCRIHRDRRTNHSVLNTAPLEGRASCLPIAPYALGAWLGDGSSAGARITCETDEIPMHIEACGYQVTRTGSMLYRITLPDSAVTGTCSNCGSVATGRSLCTFCYADHGTFRALLRKAGVLGGKHIPAAYLRAPESDRRALLAGLMDTDGTVVKGVGSCQFAVTSKRLADDVYELVVSLGYKCGRTSKRVQGRSEETSTCFILNFSTTDDVFHVHRKHLAHKEERPATTSRIGRRYVTEVRPVASVPVRCVQVDNDDHLYLAGRAMIPTHNSTLGLDICRAASIHNNLASCFFSLEMTRSEITMRLLSAESRVPLNHIRNGQMNDDDWSRLARKMAEVSSAPMFIDDSPNMTMMEIRAKARRLKQRHDLRLIIIDYMQLMSSGKKVESRQLEVSEFSRQIKLLAKELEVPIIALSQLNRGPEQRGDKRPMMSDLRESGCLTADTRLMRADTNAEITLGELMAGDVRDIPVWSLDDRLKLVPRTLTHAFPSGTKKVFEVTLTSGRRVRATANHPFLTYEGWMALGQLDVGSRVGSIRHVPPPLNVAARDQDEIVLLAHMLGDGSFLKRQPIRYASIDEANLSAVAVAASGRFGITPIRDEYSAARVTTLRLPAPYHLTHGKRNPIAAWLDEDGLFGLRSHEKFVPDWVFALPKEQVGLFLRHIWATDGSVRWTKNGDASIHYATTSRRLADDIGRLLARVNVLSQVRVARSPGRRECFHVNVESSANQARFLKDIGVHGARGQDVAHVQRLLESVKPRARLDTIPIDVWERVRSVMVEQGVDASTVARAAGADRVSALSRSAPSRERIHKVAEVLGDADLELLATNDIYWDRIASIENIGEHEVYDATVLGTHNFIANQVPLHNSLEQDADMVILLHREDVYEKESTRPGEADLIVAKHRNGPTRDITVAFQGHYSRFVDMAH